MTTNSNNSNSNKTETIVVIDYNDLIRFYENEQKQHQKQDGNNNNNDKNDKNNNVVDTNDNDNNNDNNNTSLLLLQQIENAFGYNGYGIIGISNVPELEYQRLNLLSLSRKLPSIPNINNGPLVDAPSYYSVGWSHGKEQFNNGQPDYSKGSYYANPLTDDLLNEIYERYNQNNHNSHDDEKKKDSSDIQILSYIQKQVNEHPELYAKNIWPNNENDANDIVPNFKEHFCTLSQTLIQIGIYVASLCDSYCDQQQQKQQHHIDQQQHESASSLQLCHMIQQSKNCKGRLLHYFEPSSSSSDDNDQQQDNDTDSSESSQYWCAWHNDHGSLTGLVHGIYFDINGNEVSCPDEQSGLYVLPRNHNNTPIRVCLPKHVNIKQCALYQIGETSQILSGGILCATPHAVMMPKYSTTNNNNNITRESFAVFMEPEFHTMLSIPNHCNIIDDISLRNINTNTTTDSNDDDNKQNQLSLPSLTKRYKEGQTFGDFHLATISSFATT